MTELTFAITFHGWFRVGAELGRDGLDVAIDHDDPLPGDSLKGAMLASARDVLGDAPVVARAFGTPAAPSPWHWSSALPGKGGWTFDRTHRIEIDETSDTARKDHLVVSELAWAADARFTVTQLGRLTADECTQQVVTLVAAARATHHLGGWRRRGLGWVGIAATTDPATGVDLTAVLELRGAGR